MPPPAKRETPVRCKYLVCDGEATAKVRLNVLDPADRAVRETVELCGFHVLAFENWLPHYRPHLTDGGAVYVGELDELVVDRRASA